MEIIIKKLTIANFKGIKKLVIDFGQENTISGRNATGKSSVADSFHWLLFGKNSQDKKDFEIKPLNHRNETTPQIETEVEGLLEVDGSQVTLKRVYREKWVKPKGQIDLVFSGNETLFFWNEVPISQADYKEKIDSICTEEVFKLITNPTAFTALHWEKQRGILFKMAGDVSTEDILNQLKPDQKDLLRKQLEIGKSLEEYKKEAQAKKRKLNEELQQIPNRVDEVHRNMPDRVDEAAVNTEIAKLNAEIAEIDRKIADETAANKAANQVKIDKQNELHKLLAELSQLKFEDAQKQKQAEMQASSQANSIKADIQGLEAFIERNEREVDNTKKLLEAKENQLRAKREEWIRINTEKFDFSDHQDTCPTCKRALDLEYIEAKKTEMEANFNLDKKQRLSVVDKQGHGLKAEIDALKAEITQAEAKILEASHQMDNKLAAVESSPATIATALQPNPKIAELDKQVSDLSDLLSESDIVKPTSEATYLSEIKGPLTERVQSLKAKLAVNAVIDQNLNRIKELEAQAKKLGQEIADIERAEYAVECFTKKQIELVESRINGLFKMVAFKMYDQQINGGEAPTCKALINGVPFADANNASRINAGIDIINALAQSFGKRAPIFCDNSESINKLLPTESQIVKLVVTDTDVTLRVAVTKEFSTLIEA